MTNRKSSTAGDFVAWERGNCALSETTRHLDGESDDEFEKDEKEWEDQEVENIRQQFNAPAKVCTNVMCMLTSPSLTPSTPHPPPTNTNTPHHRHYTQVALIGNLKKDEFLKFMGVYRLSPNLMFDRPCYIKEAGVEETHYLYRTTSTAHPISLWRVTDHKHDMYEEKGFLSSKNAAELPVDSGIEWLFRSGRKGSWSLADISCFEVNTRRLTTHSTTYSATPRSPTRHLQTHRFLLSPWPG